MIKWLFFIPLPLLACILSTEQLFIPGYPDAFNPSIIAWNGKFLLSFRNIANPKDSYNSSEIGLIWLNASFQVISTPQIILGPGRAEDARLINVDDHIYMVYSDNEDPKLSKGGFRVCVAEIKEENAHFSLLWRDRCVKFERENPLVREKNWTPFVYQHTLLLSYSLNPHLVFKPLLRTGECQIIAEEEAPLSWWKWGDLRGGTQAFLIGDRYLTFFHSSVKMSSEASGNKEMLHYFMGAATFEEEPPFKMTHISALPIVDETFFTGPVYKPYWGSWRGIFPGGFLFNDDFIWIVYGKQNHELWVVKLDKEKLLTSLLPLPLLGRSP